MVVTATPPVEPPVWQILVDLAAFDARAGRDVVLAARWSIINPASRQVLVVKQTDSGRTDCGRG